MRISRGRPPSSVTLPTPGTRSSRVLMCLSVYSVKVRIDWEPETRTARIGFASGSTRSTTGGSTSGGSSPRTAATFSRTCCAFSRMSYSSSNSMNRRDSESLDWLRSDRIPSIVLTDSSRTSVTSRSIVSAAAPRSSVRTVTIGNSTRGHRSMPRRGIDTTPSTTRPPISITAKTGLRMQTSASFKAGALPVRPDAGSRRPPPPAAHATGCAFPGPACSPPLPPRPPRRRGPR